MVKDSTDKQNLNANDLIISVIKASDRRKPPVCSDHDRDCNYVEDPMRCFMGFPTVRLDGRVDCLPLADGICPLMKK